MKKSNVFKGFLVVCALSLSLIPASSNAITSTAKKPVKKLLWSQEFNMARGKQVDFRYWKYDEGDGSLNGIAGWGNNEEQYYTKTAARTNGQGQLIITATRMPVVTPENPTGEPTEANPYLCVLTYKACAWTSSRINTAGKVTFKYGRIEARMKMPKGDGAWPALWMLGKNIATTPWPASGEIDIIEATGNDPFTVRGTIHGPGYSGGDGPTGVLNSARSIHDTYNVYAIEWGPNKIQWFFNGKKHFQMTANDVKPNPWPFNQEFYLVTNLAMGGWFGGQVDPDLQKAQLAIDWIRFYSVNGVGKVYKR